MKSYSQAPGDRVSHPRILNVHRTLISSRKKTKLLLCTPYQWIKWVMSSPLMQFFHLPWGLTWHCRQIEMYLCTGTSVCIRAWGWTWGTFMKWMWYAMSGQKFLVSLNGEFRKGYILSFTYYLYHICPFAKCLHIAVSKLILTRFQWHY